MTDTPTQAQIDAAAKLAREERLERFGTIAVLIVSGVIMQAIGAPESIVGGAFGAAAALTKSNATRGAALWAGGAGAILGAMVGDLTPILGGA